MPWTTVTLCDGRQIPSIGFGSAYHPPSETAGVIDLALENGFSHIDTAQKYGNETEVGTGLKLSHLPRSEIFVTTKWSGLAPIVQSAKESLDRLGLEYVDLYLIHGMELCGGPRGIIECWRQMEEVVKLGYAKSIGVSNCYYDDLNLILYIAKIKPVVNQILFHPITYNSVVPLLEMMQENGVALEGYSPLAPLKDWSSPRLNAVVFGISRKRGVGAEQVLLAWSKAKGAIPLTSSSNKARIQAYIAAGDLELSPEEIKAIDRAGYVSPSLTNAIRTVKVGAKWVALAGLTCYAGWKAFA